MTSESGSSTDEKGHLSPAIASQEHPYPATFAEMWYQIFLCAVFSSIFVHTIAAAIAFATLRKHKFGKFFPIFILVMGLFIPVTSGSVSSAAIAFVYRASIFKMSPWFPVVWGVGHTVLAACIGFTRILATL